MSPYLRVFVRQQARKKIGTMHVAARRTVVSENISIGSLPRMNYHRINVGYLCDLVRR